MEKKQLKVGLLGVGRGMVLWNYCVNGVNARLVAVCDKSRKNMEKAKQSIRDDSVTYYDDFDEFLRHDMDIVFLANYATEHAPFAIKAMEAGKDVISEVLPVQTMAQAVALIECVEKTGRNYFYAENYCYMDEPFEMKRRYMAGDLGEFEYGEGEYMHNCEPIWAKITQGNPNHWRNAMSAFYYCTHSVGPLLHITGLRPVKVVGVEGPFNPRMARMGARAGNMAIEIVTLENGGLVKSIHGVGPSKNSIWYSVYGAKGRLESPRESSFVSKLVYADLDKTEGISEDNPVSYRPRNPLDQASQNSGHNGSDYKCLWNVFSRLSGNTDADTIDVYEAVNMWMVGFFGYLSAMNNSAAQEIPDLRKKEIRELYRNDHRCTDPAVAGEQLIPSCLGGKIQIAPEIYENIRAQWEDLSKEET